tara:strand:- start:2563 stop:2901 length:339 start_codon:yes stop_codon:yes gene_type:complete
VERGNASIALYEIHFEDNCSHTTITNGKVEIDKVPTDGLRRNLTAGWSLISFGGDLNEPIKSLNHYVMNAVKKSRKTVLKATTGFSLPFTLIYSGYCKSINIFGVSNNTRAR